MLRSYRISRSIMERYRRARPVELDQPAMDKSYPKPTILESNMFKAPVPFAPASYIRSPVPAHAKVFVPPSTVVQPANPKRLRVALVGAPNAGKSSFLNQVLKRTVGAVSSKANTTRESILGVYTQGDVQIEFVDCPGIVPWDGSRECKDLSAEAWTAFNDCECALFIVDAVKKPTADFLGTIRRISPKPDISDEYSQYLANPAEADKRAQKMAKPVLLVLNKSDLVEDRKWLKIRNLQLSAHANFERCFFVSAKEGHNVDKLLEYLKAKAVPGNWQFTPDTVTTLSMTQQLEQMIRSFLFTWFNKDVPYKIDQQTVGWTERLDGSLVIEHELVVKDSVVARMLMGTQHRLLQRLKENVVFKLKQNWGIDNIVLMIHVKSVRQRESKRDKIEQSKKAHMATFLSRGAGS